MGLFGKSKTDKEKVDEWSREIKKEQRAITRQIRDIEREEAKVKAEIKKNAKKGDTESCKILARSIVDSKKAKTKLHTANANMNSILMQMREQLSMIRMSGAIQNSTAVMTAMNNLIKVPEVQKSMMNMAREMEKSNMINEIMQETIDDALEVDESAVDAEVENVLYELTAGVLGTAPKVADGQMPASQTVQTQNVALDEDDLDARMQALR